MARRSFIHPQTTESDEPLINLMPLIDVVFVVLIMFIVIAPMVKADQVPLNETKIIEKESDLKGGVSVKISQDGSILVNQVPVKASELSAVLQSYRQQTHEKSFQLFYDENASYKMFQNAREQGRKAGFEDVQVITFE